MTKLEEIAMRESPLLARLRKEAEPTETVEHIVQAPASFADKFLARYYTAPDAWLQRVQAETDRQVAAYGEQLSRYLLCKVSPADMVIAKHVAPRCECGSGSDDPSGAHSHWCKLWVAP